MCPGGPFVNAGHNVDGLLDNGWVDGRKRGERPRSGCMPYYYRRIHERCVLRDLIPFFRFWKPLSIRPARGTDKHPSKKLIKTATYISCFTNNVGFILNRRLSSEEDHMVGAYAEIKLCQWANNQCSRTNLCHFKLHPSNRLSVCNSKEGGQYGVSHNRG